MIKKIFNDVKSLDSVQYKSSSLETPEQVSEFCKVRLKSIHSTDVIPLSPIVMPFVQMKQNDFNLALFHFLAEEFHEKLKSEKSLSEYSKIFTNFSQAFNLCRAQKNTDTLEHSKKK